MALRVHWQKKHGSITFNSGHFYTFKYRAWNNDPTPTYIHMYAFSGTHPNTGRQWRFIQGLNLTYIPRAQRKRFVNTWKKLWLTDNQINEARIRFNWETVKKHYPYLQNSIRRYFYTPGYYITKLEEIPPDKWDSVVVSTWSKDFSKKVKTGVMKAIRKIV